jgi:hypothetical protein
MPTKTDPGDVRDDQAAQTRSTQPKADGLNPAEKAQQDQIDASRGMNKSDDMSGFENDVSSNSEGDGATGQSQSSGSSGSKGSKGKPTNAAAGQSNKGGGAASGMPAANAAAMGASQYKMALKFAQTNRNKFAGGGIAGGIIAIVVIGFFALLPLKLESMMKNILEKRVSNRIEHYMETRADKMVEKYLTSSVGEDDTEFKRAIVATGSPIADLYKTWRVNKFETQLEDNQGVRFQKGADGGVDVYQDGDLVGNLTDAQARVAFSDAVRSETKWYQFYKRLHLRSWMRNAYGISKWSFFQKAEGEKAAETEVDTELDADAAPAATEGADQVLTCIAGGSCLVDEGNPDEAARGGIPEDISQNTGGAADSSVEGAVNGAESSAEGSAVAAEEKAGATVTSRVLTKILGQDIAESLGKLFAAAKGPLIIITAVDLASRIDHFFWYGEADKVIVNIHKIQYAAQFAEWLTISDNIKDGTTVSGDEFNATMGKLNGTENSCASQLIYQGGTGSNCQSVTTGNDKADNSFNRSIDESAHPIEDDYRAIMGAIQEVDPQAGGTSLHDILEAWYETGGKVWGLINNILGDVFSFVFHIITNFIPILGTAFNWLMSNIASLLSKLVLWVVGSAVDGTEVGADLMNGIDAGGAVVGMDFARNLGAPMISTLAASQLDDEIAEQQQATDSRLSIADRLFSTDYTHSLVNTIAFNMPSTPSGAVSDSVNYLANIVYNPVKAMQPLLGMFGIGNANAANSAASDYGLTDWGYTDAQLNGDDTAALNQAWATATVRLGHTPTYGEMLLDDCPAVADPTKDPNLCRLDIATIQSMGAKYTTADDGGIGGP